MYVRPCRSTKVWVVVRFPTIPNCLHKLSHNFYSNWAPLSVVIVAGVPKRAIQPLKKASATISAWIFTNGMASDQRVNRSTQVSRYLKPSEYGRGPTISICMWSNLSVGSENLQNWLIMTRYSGGLATFSRTALIRNVYIHAVPNKSCIDQWLGSPMRWMT